MTGQLTPGKAPAVASITDDLERIAIGMVGLTTRALAHAESDLELTFPQWRAILVVGAEIEGARIGEVAARVGGTLPATGRLLRRLERRDLVALATDDADRRATRARLTERGLAMRETILSHRRGVLETVAEKLRQSDRLDLGVGLRLIADDLERYA
jgi:DNA-binding MarR family transcriptional regulator